MSQGILFLLFKSGEFSFDRVSRFGIRNVARELGRCLLPIHEAAVWHQPSHRPAMLDYLDGLAVLDFPQEFAEVPGGHSSGCLSHNA